MSDTRPAGRRGPPRDRGRGPAQDVRPPRGAEGPLLQPRARRLSQHLRPQRRRQDDHAARARHAAHGRRRHASRSPATTCARTRCRCARAIGLISHNPMLYPDLTAAGEPALLRRHVRRRGPRGAHHRAARAPRAQPPPPRRRAHLQQGHAPAARHRARHPAPAARPAARRAALRPRPARRRHPRRPARRDPRRAHLRHGHAQHRQGPRVGHPPDDHRGRPHRLRACGRRRPRVVQRRVPRARPRRERGCERAARASSWPSCARTSSASCAPAR